MKKYKKRCKSIEKINFIFLTNYLFEKRFFSIDTQKTQESVRKPISAYSEFSRRADHEYLVSFNVTAAIVALLS
jgi:hypothetical protein